MSDENAVGPESPEAQLLQDLMAEVKSMKSIISGIRDDNNLRAILDHTEIRANINEAAIDKLDRRSMEIIAEIELPKLGNLLPKVMGTIDTSTQAGERSGPNDLLKLRNQHYRTMLLRYIFAGRTFCESKHVLDLCCGRGWGTSIIAQYANRVIAIDHDETVITANRLFWDCEQISWRVGDALAAENFPPEAFDVVTGMEIIEHFTREEGEVLFDNILRALRPGGYFVGTSAFPAHRKHADSHPALQTVGHKYLWTRPELREYLAKNCENLLIVDAWMLIFQKSVVKN